MLNFFTHRLKFKTLIILIILPFFLISFTLVYWYIAIDSATYTSDLNLGIGNWDQSTNWRTRLPGNTPTDIYDQLDDLALDNTDQVLNLLVDSVIDFILYPGFNNDITIASSIENLFSDNPTPTFHVGDIIIYLELINGEYSTIVIDVLQDYTVGNWEDDFVTQLENSWGVIQYVSSDFSTTVKYYRVDAPILYQGNYYLARWNELTDIPGESSGWFKIEDDLSWNDTEVYHYNHIVLNDDKYYHHLSSYSAGNNPLNAGWAWREIEIWDSNTNYTWYNGITGALNVGNSSYDSYRNVDNIKVVRINDDGKWRFYKLLADSSLGQMPGTSTTSAGIWQEMSNGWIGGTGEFVYSHYSENNVYLPGDIIIYQIDPKHQYSYWKALQHVPAEIMPYVIDELGNTVVNEDYWELVIW